MTSNKMESGGFLSTFFSRLLVSMGMREKKNDDDAVDFSHLRPEDCKFPMFVLPIKDAIAVTGKDGDLPCHEDLRAEGLLVQYDPTTMGKCLFMSHTWLRYNHPDSAEGLKKDLLNTLLSGIVSGKTSFHAYWFAVVGGANLSDTPAHAIQQKYHDGFVWLDWWAIPQRDRAAQGLAIASIPYYVASTHEFIVLAGPWYHENESVRDLLAWQKRGYVSRLSRAPVLLFPCLALLAQPRVGLIDAYALLQVVPHGAGLECTLTQV
jgi:hypothetical protein